MNTRIRQILTFEAHDDNSRKSLGNAIVERKAPISAEKLNAETEKIPFDKKHMNVLKVDRFISSLR